MKKLLVLILMGLALIMLAGCNGGSTEEVKYDNGDGNLEILVDWNDFSTMEPAALSNEIISQSDIEITHTGARVEYVDENASFSQSVEKTTAEEQGVITFEIPASDNVNLYTVAVVQKPEERFQNRALWLGYIEGVQIGANTINQITMDDINWVKADWRADETKDEFKDGYITVSNEEKYYDFPFYVRDPYQIGEEVNNDGALITISGRKSIRENKDGWREFLIIHENPDSQPGEATYDFQPFVKAREFNLSTDGYRYFIPPIIEEYTINWE